MIEVVKISDRERLPSAVFIGGFWGEYGWQFARFQPKVRHFCEKNQDAYTIVMSDKGYHHIYPFADEFWCLPDYFVDVLEKDGVYRETARMWFKGASSKTKEHALKMRGKMVEEFTDKLDSEFKSWRRMSGKQVALGYPHRSAEPLYVETTKWSDSVVKPYLCVSYRYRDINDKGNWSIDNWREVIDGVSSELGLKDFVVLGRPHEVEMFTGEKPKADDNLARSIDLLTHCAVSITPESGSGFLSTMCGAPTVTFGHPVLEERYTDKENFLSTPIEYIADASRSFTPDQVIRRTVEFVKGM